MDIFSEDWLRSIGFKPKTYQGETLLAIRIEPCLQADSQWVEVEDELNGRFAVRRWSPMYSDGVPPDRVGFHCSSRNDLLQMLGLFGAKAPTTEPVDVASALAAWLAVERTPAEKQLLLRNVAADLGLSGVQS